VGGVGLLADLIVVAGFAAFMALCAVYAYLADRMVSGR
jgi:hypothetical protein